jgi:hypothetical protein
MTEPNDNLDALVNDGNTATILTLEEVPETLQENTLPAPTISWVEPLANEIGENGLHIPVEFTEFGRHTYRFEEIYTPDAQQTGAFAGFYKDEMQPEPVWQVLKGGLLSKEYVVAKVNPFYDELARQVEFDGEPIVHGAPFILSATGKTTTPIDVLGDDEAKLAFEIISGVSSDVLSNANSNVDVCVTNTYNGTASIRIDFAVHIKLQNSGNDRIGFRDYFTLTNRNHTFTHTTHSLGAVSADLTQIQQHYNESTTILKGITHNVDIHADKLAKCLKKTEKGIFNSYWENLPPEHRNFLVAILIASYCLDLNYDVRCHMNMRSYIQKQMTTIFASRH